MKYDWLDEIENSAVEYECETSEEFYKISPQPKDTCPLIDELVSLNDTQMKAKLEEIRQQCKAIRQWGFEWKILAKSLVENYPEKEHNDKP